ncbi:hypothetical protein GGTG_13791 [Gaeumannomyces tritici R3-111a-1]|uniref:Uncharacterized protein n=1 Tax=Gaeumannomyces tritici (strain R3-111a-1) TaxID=644352 RepID=J3PJV2_GAET3|nr:hypothetical protein GGTG_13791 [Gaeumannomyces tritici R3-111a-1]EJT68636.1 hypothetical protein GGTG_13791 [Gaeumannomyces tritici R3-111a-1]
MLARWDCDGSGSTTIRLILLPLKRVFVSARKKQKVLMATQPKTGEDGPCYAPDARSQRGFAEAEKRHKTPSRGLLVSDGAHPLTRGVE